MELNKEQIKQGLDKAYKQAGHNAYFGNGFEAGVQYAQEQFKILNIPCVTVSYFDTIQKGFKKLQEDCTEVRLVGFCPKEEIPDEAHREEFEDDFDHEYQLTQSDGYDEAIFCGDIYLQLDTDLYMRFDVMG